MSSSSPERIVSGELPKGSRGQYHDARRSAQIPGLECLATVALFLSGAKGVPWVGAV